MVGIVYATLREAQPFLSRTSAQAMPRHPLALFEITAERGPSSIVAISGMGKVAAAMAAVHLVVARRVTLLINAGLCGRLIMDDGWFVGELLRISSAVEGDCDRFGHPEKGITCRSDWFGQMKAARLVTCDRPVFDPARRIRLATMGEVADMEGAAVARVAGRYGIPWAMIKGISDLADTSGRQDIAAHIDKVSGHIANALVRELNNQASFK